MPYANIKGADQPAHPRSLISAFVFRYLYSTIPLVSIHTISSLYLASVAALTGLSLSWSQTPKTGFPMMRLIFLLFCTSFSELTCTGKCAHLFDRKRDVSKGNFKVIGNLRPFTEYSFAVQGYSGNGAGLLSGEVIVRTLEAGRY